MVPTGVQRDAIARWEMTTAQLSYLVLPTLPVTGRIGCSRSHDLVSASQPTLDACTYDAGARICSGKQAARLAYTSEGHGLRGLAKRNDLTVRYFRDFDRYPRRNGAAGAVGCMN